MLSQRLHRPFSPLLRAWELPWKWAVEMLVILELRVLCLLMFLKKHAVLSNTTIKSERQNKELL